MVDFIVGAIFFIGIILGVILDNKKRKREVKRLESEKKSIKSFECNLVDGSDVLSSHLGAVGPTILCNVLLFDDHIGLATDYILSKWPSKIMMQEINFVRIEKLLGNELLLINYTKRSEDGAKQSTFQFYLKDEIDILLCIKNFIEERMNRPQIIDLTGGDQTAR